METEKVISGEELVRILSYPLYKNKGWIRFFGIISIVYGVFTAITIVGIVFAWLPIWLGVLVTGAVNKVEKAYIVGDQQAIVDAQNKLSTYFLINAIVVLVGIILLAIFLVVAFTTGFYHNMWNEMHSQGIY